MKFLWCFYSFCKSCIESLVCKEYGKEGFVVCFLCFLFSELGSKGIDVLLVNFFIGVIFKKRNFVVEEKKVLVRCGNCEDNVEVIGYCSDCLEFLCDRCMVVYRWVCVIREY